MCWVWYGVLGMRCGCDCFGGDVIQATQKQSMRSEVTQDSNVGEAWCELAQCIWEVFGNHPATGSRQMQSQVLQLERSRDDVQSDANRGSQNFSTKCRGCSLFALCSKVAADTMT